MSSDQHAKTTAEQLTQAMRGFVSAVTVISAADEQGIRNAMTATSPTAVSMDPPSMLICVNRSTSFYTTVSQADSFCINVLLTDQLPIAQLCSSRAKGEERFVDPAWHRDDHGVPYLASAQAAIICDKDQVISYGTHDIIIGKVRSVICAAETDPLVYAEGQYRSLAAIG